MIQIISLIQQQIINIIIIINIKMMMIHLFMIHVKIVMLVHKI